MDHNEKKPHRRNVFTGPVPIINPAPAHMMEDLPKTDKDREAEAVSTAAKERTAMFTPLGEAVAVKVIRVEKTEGGIALPQASQDKYETPFAVVFAVGPECKWVKPGMTILAAVTTPGASVFYKGDRYLLLKESALVGVVGEITKYVPDPTAHNVTVTQPSVLG